MQNSKVFFIREAPDLGRLRRSADASCAMSGFFSALLDVCETKAGEGPVPEDIIRELMTVRGAVGNPEMIESETSPANPKL